MSYVQGPKTDLGTILIHWLMVVALLGAAASGLAIASLDNPDFELLPYVRFLLPSENVWFVHLACGIALLSSLVAYAVYIRRAKLGDRIQLNGARLKALFFGGRHRWSSFNVLLYWVLFVVLAAAIISGCLLFFGWGGPVLKFHLHSVWFCLAYPFVHALGHWLYGGEGQLLRIFKPKWRLPQRAPQLVDALIERIQHLEIEKKSNLDGGISASSPLQKLPKTITIAVPLAIAAAGAAAIVPLSTTLDEQSRQSLRIARIDPASAPALDGDHSHASWRRTAVAAVVTQHGANFDGGESRVEVRAVHDGIFAYFAFTWADPTRSLTHMPLIKQKGGWRLLRSASPGNESQLHEDKFAVLLAAGGQHLIGKGIHFGKKPIQGKPKCATGRGLHYIAGGYGDIWQWRAAHGGMAGWIDNGHFGPPLPADTAQASGRYTGGFAVDDPGSLPYEDNFDALSDRDAYPLVRPRRIPKTLAQNRQVQPAKLDAEESDSGEATTWLTDEDSVPFSDEADRSIPVGAVIPSVLLKQGLVHGPNDVIGSARWSGGRWSLEVKRRLKTGSPLDVEIKTGALMWVAAFDHAETWHTYHVRPFELEVE